MLAPKRHALVAGREASCFQAGGNISLTNRFAIDLGDLELGESAVLDQALHRLNPGVGRRRARERDQRSSTSLDEDERKFNDPSIGVATNVVITTLDVTWRVLDGGTGASLASGIAESRDQIRNTANTSKVPPSSSASDMVTAR